LDGEDLVKRLARITHKSNIPCCDLADRLVTEFSEEVCLPRSMKLIQHFR